MAGPEVRAAGYLLSRGRGAAERFLLLCNRDRGEWGFPKGHARSGEPLPSCARRECAEECGIGLVAVAPGSWELAYALPDGRRKRVVYYRAVTAQEAVTLSREHREAAWVPVVEVARRLPFASLRALFRRHLEEREPPC